MRKKWAAVGSSVFFVVGPGMVAGLIPWTLTRGSVRHSLPGDTPVHALVAGGAVLTQSFARFVVESH